MNIDKILDKHLGVVLTEGMGRKFNPLPAEQEKSDRAHRHSLGFESARRSEKRDSKKDKDFLGGYDEAVKVMKSGIISKY